MIEPAPEVEVLKKTGLEDAVVKDGTAEMISNLGCDLGNLRITFSLTNMESDEKTLKPVGAFEDAGTALKVSINGKHIRDLPGACSGKDSIAAGETLNCEMQFESSEEINNFGIKTGESYEGFTSETRKNRISARTLKVTDETYFNCA